MSSTVLVRVINKNKDGALVQSMDGTYEDRIAWKDFSEYFTHLKENIYSMKVTHEINEEAKKIEERINWLIPYMPTILMIMNKNNKGETPSLTELSMLGNVVDNYQTKFGLNQMDFIREVNYLKAQLTKGFQK